MAKDLGMSATLELIDKVSKPLLDIQLPLQKTQKAFEDARNTLKEFEGQQSSLDSFVKKTEKLAKTSEKFNEAQKRVEQLRNKLRQTERLTTTLVKQIAAAERQSHKLGRRLESESQSLETLKKKLQDAGINTDKLSDEQLRLSQVVKQAKRSFDVQTDEMLRQKKILAQLHDSQKKYQSIRNNAAIVARAGKAALSLPIKASIDFESSMADVKKVVDFGDDPVVASQGLKQMSDEIIKLSTIYPMAAKDIATIIAAGGQSGIARGELTQFGADAIKMGVAFDIGAEQAGQSMAELRNAFSMSQSDVVALADKINYLSNNTPAAAQGIMDIVQRIGPLGAVGGYADGSIAALGATMRGMGVQEEVAATGIKNMMLALSAGEAATKSQQQAFQALGIDYAQIAKDMQTDAEGTTLKILESVSHLDKHQQASTLKQLFGSESLAAIAPLLTNLQALQSNLQMVGDKSKYAGSMNNEYEARAATTANNIQLLKNNLSAVGITLGNSLLPALNEFLGFLRDVAGRIQEWAAAHPQLAGFLMKTVAAITIFAGALSGLSAIMLTIIGPMAMLQASLDVLSAGSLITKIVSGFSMVTTAISHIGGVIRIISSVMMANPIFLLLGLLATLAYTIYQNWDTLGPMFSNLWNIVVTSASYAIEWIVNAWNGFVQNIINFATNLWSNLGITFNVGIQTLIGMILAFTPLGLFVQAFSPISGYFTDLVSRFTNFGANLLEGLKNGILSKAQAVIGAITSISNRIKNAFTGSKGMDIHSPSRIFLGFGRYIMQGLTNGLLADDSPIRTMLRTSDNLRNAMDTSEIRFDKRKPIATSMSMAQGVNANNGSQQQPLTINIYTQPNQDEQQIARLVAQEVAKQQTNNTTALYDTAEVWA